MDFLSHETQGTMIRIFTAITTAGVLGIPIVGRLMDKCGFVATAAVTVTLAVLYGLGVLWPGEPQLILAFVAYALFRTFLFTYFFAYLAEALGFKFFGVLAGVAFFVAGMAGLLQSPLMEIGAGTCHLDPHPQPGCFMGNWGWINIVQLGCLLSLYLVPIMDAKESSKKQQQQPLMAKRTPSFGSASAVAGNAPSGATRSPHSLNKGSYQPIGNARNLRV